MMRPVVAALLLSLVACGASRTAELPIAIAPGRNFYEQEQWEPGKLRRWMRNDGELRIENRGNPMRIDLRFVAESFRIPRRLQVRLARQVVLELTIPAEPLYAAAKDLPLAGGETVVTFSASPGPDQASRYFGNGDQRDLSIAFGPFSAVDARAPQAQREETAAFPQADKVLPQLSPTENAAGDLRRQGRLLEARDAYQEALASDRVDPTTYVWQGLTLIALDDLSGARGVLTRGRRAEGASLAAVSVRQASAKILDYLGRSQLLAHQDQDPGHAFRRRGEIYRAVMVYRRMLQQAPDDLVASYWLGLLSGIAERPREATPLLEAVARGRPDDPDGAMAKELLRYAGGR